MDLSKFKYKQTLNENQTEKTLILLGTIQNQEHLGEAIIILSLILPKISNSEQYKAKLNEFGNIKQIFINDIYGKFEAQFMNRFQVQSIFPITQKHKDKYLNKVQIIARQTAQQYQAWKQQNLAKQISHTQWVQNILDGKAQTQRVLFKNEDIVILPDFKFHNLQQPSKLHLLCLFTSKELNSLRDLNSSHLQLLKNTFQRINKSLQTTFGKDLDIWKCRVYFHYKPTFYRLHLHIQYLNLDTKACNVERCHELLDVIQNIEIKSDYYQKITLNTLGEVKNNI